MAADDRPTTEPPSLWMAGRIEGQCAVREGDLTSADAHRVRSLYCATKPMVAMGVLSLLERHGVDWMTAGIDPDGGVGSDGRWPITGLLAHRSSLIGPTIWEVLRLPLGRVDGELAGRAERAAAEPDGPRGYSEVLAGWVLGRAAGGVGGEHWARDLEAALRGALAESRLWLLPDRELLSLPVSALGTLTARHGPSDADVPLVYALGERNRALVSPHLGGYGTAASVVTWFHLLGRHLRGDVRDPALFPAADRLRDVLARSRPADRAAAYSCALEVGPGPSDLPTVGVQAAGGALSVALEPASGRVAAVLGGRFEEDPARRRAWLQQEWLSAGAWAEEAAR